MWILKESGCGREWKVRGQECVWLIAIDYHTVAGTAGVKCKGVSGHDIFELLFRPILHSLNKQSPFTLQTFSLQPYDPYNFTTYEWE